MLAIVHPIWKETLLGCEIPESWKRWSGNDSSGERPWPGSRAQLLARGRAGGASKMSEMS